MKVNVDADGLVDRYAAPYLPAGPDEDEAIEIARRAVAQEKLDADDYLITARAVQTDHWVVFDQRGAASKPRCWPYHFSVRVKPDGSAQIYKDR